LISNARNKRIPIIYANDEHLEKIDNELKLWGNHAIKGTKGAQIIKELKPSTNDYIISKRRYSAFFNTNLQLLLQELKVDTLIINGIYADVCIAHTVADAFQWGYKVIIPKDTINGFTQETYEASLEYFRKNYGVEITTVNQIIKRI
jgi:nicotinamidase-related amidase